MDSIDMTLNNIEKLRKRMIEAAESNGRTHPSAVAMSTELDELLNQYETMKNEKLIKERASGVIS